jgi:hypothetical protein
MTKIVTLIIGAFIVASCWTFTTIQAQSTPYFSLHSSSPTPFVGHEGFQLSTCSDAMYFTGGSYPSTDPVTGAATTTYTNEVYKLSGAVNAETWSLVSSTSGWSARTGHRALVLPNQAMLIAGGRKDNTYYNDVWFNTHCSEDVWTQLPNAPYTGRINSQMQWWLNQVVWFGGYDGVNRYNDVWTLQYNATTGRVADTWVQQPNAQWPVRNSFASIVWGNTMYVMDGDGAGSVLLNDMWYATSVSGPWTQLFSATPWSARRGALLWLWNNELIFGTGLGANNTFFNDVWVFTRTTPSGPEGTWSLMNTHDAYSPRQGGRKANYRGRAFMIGGNAPDGTRLNDVWQGPLQPVASSSSSTGAAVSSSSTSVAISSSSSTAVRGSSSSSTGSTRSSSSTGTPRSSSSTGSRSSTGVSSSSSSTGTRHCWKNGRLKKHCRPGHGHGHGHGHGGGHGNGRGGDDDDDDYDDDDDNE